MGNAEVTTINSLVATTIDSANGFEEAAKTAKATGLASQFADMARDRWAIVEQLEAEVQRLGGSAERSGTTLGAAHRRWLDIRNMVAGSDRAVIQEVENGEAYLKTKYEAALAETGLSETARRTIEDAFASVRRSHERVRGLALTIGTTDTARQSNVDWRRIGKSLGLAAAVGGVAFAATRIARSRRRSTDTDQVRRGTTVSIDRTDRTEIEARKAESSAASTSARSSTAAANDLSSDLRRGDTTSTTRQSGNRGARSADTGGVGLAASGTTDTAGVDGSMSLPTSTGTDRGGDTSGAGFTAGSSDDRSSGTGSFGSTGGSGGDFNRS